MDAFTIGFTVIFIIVILFFLHQFRLLNVRGLIFAASALALVLGFSIFQSYRRRKLEEELKQREKALQEQEKRVKELQEKYEVSKEEIRQAEESLKRERARYMKEILEIEAEKNKKLEERRAELNDMTTDQIFEEYSKLIGGATMLLIAVLLCSSSLFAQRVEYVRPLGKNHQIKIAGADYLALSRESIERSQFIIDSLKIELKAAEQKIAAKDTLLAALNRTNSAYSRNFWLQDSLIKETQSLYQGYRDLYRDSRRLSGEPWLRFSAGLGAVREQQGEGELLPVMLMGLSIKRLALWGFINKEQSGFLAGVNYPLRLSLF